MTVLAAGAHTNEEGQGMTEPTPDERAEEAARLTEYDVLREDENQGAKRWGKVKTVAAANADAAIRKAAGDAEGVYVAVPARSWNPRTVTIKTEKRTVLE